MVVTAVVADEAAMAVVTAEEVAVAEMIEEGRVLRVVVAPRVAAVVRLEEEKTPAKSQPDSHDNRRRQFGIVQQGPGNRYRCQV